MESVPIKNLIFTLSSLMLLMSCQRDDICPETTETTPLLIIRFYDAEEIDNPQPPVNLSVKEAGNDTLLLYRVNLDSIAIPLRTTSDVTEYEFIFNADEIIEEDEDEDEENPEEEDEDDDPMRNNRDIIHFSYAREQIYINRACAFKMNFLNLKPTLNAGEDGAWIERVRIDQLDVEDETNAHISVFY